MSENPEDHPSKRRRILPSSSKPIEDQEDNENEGIFQGMRFYIHAVNPTRLRVLRSLITQHGGINSINADENVTHILVDEGMTARQLCSDLQWHTYIPQNIHVLFLGWVSASVHANRILNGRHFHFSCPRGPAVTAQLDSPENVTEDGEDSVEEVEASVDEGEASIEDNVSRGPRFTRPVYHRSHFINANNEERKFWSPVDDVSTYDDNNYDCETTCDDEWLSIKLPNPPKCDPPPETDGRVEAGVQKDDLKNNELADDASMKECISGDETVEVKDAGGKTASETKDLNKPKNTAISDPGPSTSTDVNLPPTKAPMVPFDQRPNNTVGRLSRMRLKIIPDPNGTRKKWMVVNMNEPDENEQSPNINNSTAQEASKQESGSAIISTEPNLPCTASVSSNTLSPKQSPIEVRNLNGEDMEDLSIPTTDAVNEQGHKRKKETASSEEQNEATSKASNEKENFIPPKKKISKHKQKLSKRNSIPILSDEQNETIDKREGATQKRKKKTKLHKRKESNSDSTSSDEQDESTGKISPRTLKNTTPEKSCLSSNVQVETSNIVDQPTPEENGEKFPRRKPKKSISAPASPSEGMGEKFPRRKLKKSISTPASPSEGMGEKFPRRKPKKSISTPTSPSEEMGETFPCRKPKKSISTPALPSEEMGEKFPSRKPKKSISTPASPSEGIGEKFPHANQKKNSSTPTSPNILGESVETFSWQKYTRTEQVKNTSASALPNAESWDFKMDENNPPINPNSTNANFDNVSAGVESMPSSSTTTIPNKKDEIRKYVLDFFAANLPNIDNEYMKGGDRKRSTDNIPPSLPLNLDFTMDVSNAKQSVCQQTPLEKSDFTESVSQISNALSPRSFLVESQEPGQDNETLTLAEAKSALITRSVIQFAKCTENGTSVSPISLLEDRQEDEKTLDESITKDCLKDIEAPNIELNITLGEEKKSDKVVVEEICKAESTASPVEKSQIKFCSTPESPAHEGATGTIANFCTKSDSNVDSLKSKEKVYPIELQCALNFDVYSRISELLLVPKTDRVIAEINFLKAELERRKCGSGSWQVKDFKDFIRNSESQITEEERLKNKLRIGYWESFININNPFVAKPISFTREDTDCFNEVEPSNSTINGELSHETPIRGGSGLIFPLPEPISTSQPDIVSTDVSTDGKGVVKHYLSPLCPNYKIIQKLLQLYEFFKKTKQIWRMHAYEQAIFALGKQPTLIGSLGEALSVVTVSKTIAYKVWEIACTGNLQEIDDFCNTEWETARNILKRGWGITPILARQLYRQDLCTVAELWMNANLNRSQRLGLKYYEHLSKKMSRGEADVIAEMIDKFVKVRNTKVSVEACSTIRRNKKFCSYVSILVILQRGVECGHRLLDDTVAALHYEGYVADDLIRHEDDGNQCKYSGLFQINDKARFRRVDITVVPYIEQVCARFFLTGPSYFLRATLKHAERRNMILDRHCLRLNFLDVDGQVEKVIPLHLNDERDLFTMLELEYRLPEQRDIIPFSTIVKK